MAVCLCDKFLKNFTFHHIFWSPWCVHTGALLRPKHCMCSLEAGGGALNTISLRTHEGSSTSSPLGWSRALCRGAQQMYVLCGAIQLSYPAGEPAAFVCVYARSVQKSLCGTNQLNEKVQCPDCAIGACESRWRDLCPLGCTGGWVLSAGLQRAQWFAWNGTLHREDV